MKISILHPSWKRPKLAKECYDLWMSKADQRLEIEYILCLSEKDPHLAEYMEVFRPTWALRIVIPENGLIVQVNAAAKESEGDLLIAVSDDFACPEHWDTLLREELEGKSDFLLKTQDGAQPWIITLPIMDRVYYEARGYIYPPHCVHMFGDTWMTHEGHMLGKVITSQLNFPHNHYTTGINPKDNVNVENDASWHEGERIYLEGLKNNFGIENPMPVELPMHHKQFLATKGVVV